MKKDTEMAVESIILIIVCGMTMAVVHAIDPSSRVQDYYEATENYACCTALKLASVLIIMCFAINCRFLVTYYLT